MRRNGMTVPIMLFLGLLGAVALRLVVVSWGFDWPDSGEFLELRALRAMAALVVGSALGASGCLLQSMLRNPLASPYILGISSGAGLGVVLGLYLTFQVTGLTSGQPSMIAALLGACGALALVYALSQRRGIVNPTTLILVGVIVTIMCGALSIFFQQLMPDRNIAAAATWMMGRIDANVSWLRLALIAALTLAGVVVAIWQGRALDAASLSDDEARSVGVRLDALRLLCLGIAGVLTAGSVVLAGPIGFIGLIAPHAARLIVGASHRILIPTSALMGGLLLVLAESGVSIITFSTGRMPIGVLTALVGGPVFIYLLKRREALLL